MSFSDLLKETWRFCKTKAIPILLGTIVFAAVLLIVRDYFERQTDVQIRKKFLQMGIPQERFEELNDRMKRGDQTAFDDLKMEMINVNEKIDNMTETERRRFSTQQGKDISLALLPIVIPFLIIIFIAHTFVATYFLVLASKDINHTLEAMGSAAGKLFPMMGLSIWVFIRSFLWIPIINIVCLFTLFPRYIFSGVILIKENRSIRESAYESYIRTQAKWPSILGRYIILTFCIMAAITVLVFVIPSTGFLDKIIDIAIWNLGVAFAAVFTTIYANQFSDIEVIKPPKVESLSQF
ncbi:hypothetical protein KJ652_03985 [Patescibacteria group bacterium]|nr:hypothetical protein [Patescibacteria group bacterium]MBU1123725.1 hypothetical protein [Patescibacteria group bacterium]